MGGILTPISPPPLNTLLFVLVCITRSVHLCTWTPLLYVCVYIYIQNRSGKKKNDIVFKKILQSHSVFSGAGNIFYAEAKKYSVG